MKNKKIRDLIAKFPIELRKLILGFLEDAELLNMARVSKKWSLFAAIEYHERHKSPKLSYTRITKALNKAYLENADIPRLLRNSMYKDNVVRNPIDEVQGRIDELHKMQAAASSSEKDSKGIVTRKPVTKLQKFKKMLHSMFENCSEFYGAYSLPLCPPISSMVKVNDVYQSHEERDSPYGKTSENKSVIQSMIYEEQANLSHCMEVFGDTKSDSYSVIRPAKKN